MEVRLIQAAVCLSVGYSFGELMQDLSEVHAATSYGACTYAGANGERQPSQFELDYSRYQGEYFAKVGPKSGIGNDGGQRHGWGSVCCEIEGGSQCPAGMCMGWCWVSLGWALRGTMYEVPKPVVTLPRWEQVLLRASQCQVASMACCVVPMLLV